MADGKLPARKPPRDTVELLGLGTAPNRIERRVKTLRDGSGCRLWLGALANGVPQIHISAGGISWREQVTHVVFRLHHGRWPAAVYRTCVNERCIEPTHMVEEPPGLTPDQVREARRIFLDGGSLSAYAAECGVSYRTIYMVARYQRRAFVADA